VLSLWLSIAHLASQSLKEKTTLFDSFGERFVAAGDWNIKYMYWGFRIANPKGKQLYNAIIKPQQKLNYVFPGVPTYWRKK